MLFDGYELKNYIVKALEDLKFEYFTSVQKEVFDNLNNNKNFIVKSKTGSGKTHSFLVPIFNNLDEDDYKVQALIVAPTKELSLQIYKVAQHIASFSDKRIIIKNYSGGSDRNKEIEKLSNQSPQIVIGTLGKIKDLAIKENVLKIYTAKYFVCDEADMTFDETNLEDLDNIASVLNDAKFMFFSATFSDKILPTMKKYITNVEFIDIKEAQNQIKHIWIPLKYKDRYEVLKDLLGTMQPYLCMIFCNKKDTVIELANKLSSDGYFVGMMHGDLSQRERKRILKECNELKYQFLVCTDIAARGIDIKGVSHIINYELPRDYEFYLHRSGRTGRMFNDGIVYSFYEELDNQYLDNLNKKDIKPEYFEIKNKELVPFKGRNSREARIKPKTNYELEAKKFVPKSDKVKPGYKKKREEQIKKIAESLKKRDKKRKNK